MTPEQIRSVRQALGLATLPDTGSQRSGLFVWNLSFEAGDLEGWKMAECQYALLPRGRQYLSGVWAPAGEAANRGCRLDITSHPSRDLALDELAERLGGLQIERPTWRPAIEIGERFYANEDSSLVIWLHGNLTATAARLGPNAASPLGLAHAVQRFLLRDAVLPSASASTRGAAATAAAAMQVTVGRAAPLPQRLRAMLADVRSATPPNALEPQYPVPHPGMTSPIDNRPTLVRLLAEGGSISLGAGGVEFVPLRPGRLALAALMGPVAAGSARTAWHAMGRIESASSRSGGKKEQT